MQTRSEFISISASVALLSADCFGGGSGGGPTSASASTGGSGGSSSSGAGRG